MRLPFRIGRYRVQRLLGAGGMGRVYLCDDELHGRVAVKCASRSEVSCLRLRNEARTLAQLDHPNIVRLLDTGEYDGRPFLVMEHVDGSTLREWSKASRSWEDVLRVFAQAGRALAALHDAGFVHRDFKPDNVLIGRDGVVKLADFGLARHIDESAEPVTGTAEYMPLEQLRGAKPDARSDQFAFCMSAYEAIWGELPFDHLDTAMAAQALERALPREPASRREIYRVVRRGLERDAVARWPDMHVLVRQLEALVAARRTCVLRVLKAGRRATRE